MPIADKKKCQTLINVAADAVVDLKAVADRLQAVQAAFVAASPSTAGTALDGNLSAIATWIASVRAAADSAVAAGLLAAKVPSHRGKALEV